MRTARIIGTGRMVEMMLTGRTLDAATGQTLGLSHELVEPGQAFLRALELAEIVAGNAPMSNYMILQALARIADMPAEGGLYRILRRGADPDQRGRAARHPGVLRQEDREVRRVALLHPHA